MFRFLTFSLPSARSLPVQSCRKDFHFCRIFAGDEYSVSLARHEHYLSAQLGLKPGMTVLNIGSGLGDIATELVRYADVDVVGVDSNASRVQYARNRAQQAQLSHKMQFIHVPSLANLHVLPSESFDSIYIMESLKDAADFDIILGQVAELLKPGGKVGIIDWCWTDLLDSSNPDHCRLAEIHESASRLPPRSTERRSIRNIHTALETAGLTVLHCEDLAARPDKIPWYLPLERAISDPHVPWDEDAGGLCPAFGGMSRNSASIIVQAAKYKLFTPMAVFIAQKP